ncbi:Abi family protein [Rhodococcus sp. LW-XY12]|uniref:Abi family protein n=1 Tax=Rhodococcus sp. LW-XY12 TaxID=2856851 RepID=UPI001C5821C4|nr:Abi family protein [Rhodococcus sp. LW-XY12]QXU56756.1 Abi family protein [Rhodococcus sp. LW-XY12]
MERRVSWISQARFEPFLAAADQDAERAWALYEWNAKVASALFECFHHTEVLLRNAMMRELEKTHPMNYPWQRGPKAIADAADKRKHHKTKVASPDSIISELMLGFWRELLADSPENDELWRQHLRHAFPGSSGTRQSVSKAVSDMHRLRNRCAHQDSLLDFDPGIELKKLLSLAEWIDPDARAWIESIESVSKIAAARPVPPRNNVVIVGASAEDAIAMYERVSAYVCPADRNFAPMEYMGFYGNKKIEPYFPRILEIIVPTVWNKDEQRRLSNSEFSHDKHLARVMGYGLKNGWEAGEQFQVFLLSDLKSSDTIKRSTPIQHHKNGRGSAFVQNKRYLSHTALMAAINTDHLT